MSRTTPGPVSAPSPAELRERLTDLTLVDAHRLGRRLERLRGRRHPDDRARRLATIGREVDEAAARLDLRRSAVPAVSYPEDLPITARREDIAAAIRDHQVVIVAGETGSGKTTQLPKICLELGRGVRGMVGHTQPRRLAARSVAERVAAETGTALGEAVGYTVRFTDEVSDATLVKVMTDGILLAEIQRDRRLRRYDTLIIDEAHERSLNIDFILGYLTELLPTRPDLKVVITSATIDPDRFARHFGTAAGPAPVIEVSGRTYPVEIRYRPLDPGDRDDDDAEEAGEPRDQATAICHAVDELCAEGPGDVLVFCSGEREIRDTAEALRGHLNPTPGAPVEVLPLYARLSAAEQHRVFAEHPGRRVVLATNVAETSLTVPGIRYVVDPGTARISRYSRRLKVQRLPIEAISQASADQRAGRCGRVADGVCIRLYTEADHNGRPRFTDPEVLRTNLASVILQMTAVGLGDVAAFGFVDPPDRRAVEDGIALLTELGAIDPAAEPRRRLTELGASLAQLPVDPRVARMIVEADRNGALREVLVIAAALSIQDPRERPTDAQEQARAAHARFTDPTSDFGAYLNLWRYLGERQRELSSSAFRRLCKREFLHHLRVREWQDLVAQLRRIAGGLGMRWNSERAETQQVHLALLAGLLGHVGVRDPDARQYLGARGAKFAIFPGSALARKPPRWVMAGELVETNRLWARTVARIEPEWVEPLAAHLVKRTYSEPHWEKSRGAVVGYERVTLYGLALAAGRRCDYARIDPRLCRELFIRHALVAGEWDTHHRFLADNRALRADLEDLEHRTRRRDLLVDSETVFDFYDVRIPAEVVSTRHFDRWWKKERRRHSDLLTLTEADLLRPHADQIDEHDYPDVWVQDDLRLALTYQFAPGADADGVTVHIPIAVLNRVDPDGFDWGVPGMRAELVTALIRSLPKAVRRSFVPAPDHAHAALARMRPGAGPITTALARELEAAGGIGIDPGDWDHDRIPDHLRMTFRVTDGDRTVSEGKDLGQLQRRLAPQQRQVIAAGAAEVERDGLRDWPAAGIARRHEYAAGGELVRGYPALVDTGAGVAVRVHNTEDEQRESMWAGTRRLLRESAPSPVKGVLARLDNPAKLALASAPHRSGAELFDDCANAAVEAVMAAGGGPAWDAEAFAALQERTRRELPGRLDAIVTEVVRVLTTAGPVRARLDASDTAAVADSVADMRAQLDALVHPGFVTAAGAGRLAHLVRYLRAIEHRLDKLAEAPARDAERTATVQAVLTDHRDLMSRLPAGRRGEADVTAIGWMIEELRVSLFAQPLGTAHPVSVKRIHKAMDAAESADQDTGSR